MIFLLDKFSCDEALELQAGWLFYVTLTQNRLDRGLWTSASVVFLFPGWPGCFSACEKRAGRASVSFIIEKFLNGLSKGQNIFLLQTFLSVNYKLWPY